MSEYKIIAEAIVEAHSLTDAMEKFETGDIVQFQTKEVIKLLTPKEELLAEIRKCYNSSDLEIESILDNYEVKLK